MVARCKPVPTGSCCPRRVRHTGVTRTQHFYARTAHARCAHALPCGLRLYCAHKNFGGTRFLPTPTGKPLPNMTGTGGRKEEGREEEGDRKDLEKGQETGRPCKTLPNALPSLLIASLPSLPATPTSHLLYLPAHTPPAAFTACLPACTFPARHGTFSSSAFCAHTTCSMAGTLPWGGEQTPHACRLGCDSCFTCFLTKRCCCYFLLPFFVPLPVSFISCGSCLLSFLCALSPLSIILSQVGEFRQDRIACCFGQWTTRQNIVCVGVGVETT